MIFNETFTVFSLKALLLTLLFSALDCSAQASWQSFRLGVDVAVRNISDACGVDVNDVQNGANAFSLLLRKTG